MTRNRIEQTVFLVLILLFFGWAAWDSLDFPDKAQTYPRTVAFAAVLITLIELVSYLWSSRGEQADSAAEANSVSIHFFKILPYLIWLGAFYLTIYVIGIVAAAGIFVFLFLLREGKMSWYFALLSGLIVIAFLLTMED
ncbi:MAG: tripartite tricarboxylate transporter TctB family protein, partial [Chloroflexota bacterium]